MYQHLSVITEGPQPPPQHQGRQAESMAQLLPCAVRRGDPHSSIFTMEELQNLEDLGADHDPARENIYGKGTQFCDPLKIIFPI